MKHVVLLDKPSNLTSMECVERVKEIFKIKKAGHTGTLDPKVTGLLIICLDEAVKAIPLLMGLDKEYEGIMYIHRDTEISKIQNVFKKFTGPVFQIPPVRSAVKRKKRKRTIYSLQLIKKEGKNVFFRVKCESGTYVRKLCHDIGMSLGCGAHMKWLRRISIDGFSVKEAVGLDEVRKRKERVLFSLESVLERIGIKKIWVKKEGLKKVMHGSPVRENDVITMESAKPGEIVGVYFSQRIIALGKADEKYVARIKRVFLE